MAAARDNSEENFSRVQYDTLRRCLKPELVAIFFSGELTYVSVPNPWRLAGELHNWQELSLIP